MKKGKVFSKVHITMLVMALALGAAVWLNMRFSSEKYLGEATYVDNKSSSSAVQTAAKADTDRFKEAVSEREKAYKKAEELVRGGIACGKARKGKQYRNAFKGKRL